MCAWRTNDTEMGYDEKSLDRYVKIHSAIVAFSCMALGLANWFKGGRVLPFAAVLCSGFLLVLTNVIMRSKPAKLRGAVVTQFTVILVVVLAGGTHSLYSMLTLLLGNIAISTMYFSIKTLTSAWILTTVLTGAASVFGDKYMGSSVTALDMVKAAAGFHIGCYMLLRLLKNMQSAFNAQQEETEKMRNLVENITGMAAELQGTAQSMMQTSDTITASSEEQETSIAVVRQHVDEFADSAESCYEEAEQSAEASSENVALLEQVYKVIEEFVVRMSNLEATSNKIHGIVTNIDDIAFQTNILALNAAIEAARAGAAGKGFAVVADEVRALASKSAEAAATTDTLLTESVDGIREAADHAKRIASQIAGVSQSASESAAKSRRIGELVDSQRKTVDDIQRSIAEVASVCSQNIDVAIGNANASQNVQAAVDNLNRLLSAHM